MKILIVEDDPWYAESLSNAILSEARTVGHCEGVARSNLGYLIKTVNSSDAAAKSIDTFHPDVIILDIMLGEQNGLVLLNELQSYIDTRNLPVIVLSSVASKLSSNDLRQLGVREILDKAKTTPGEIATICKEAVIARNPGLDPGDEAIQKETYG